MTASAVKQTMVMLSDAVTTMMLLVVPLQESNAPMNQELPTRTQAVAQIATKISVVADGLAQDEYDAFPEIQKEMLDASTDVRDQVGGLQRAIGELQQGSNRKRGWEILVSSCASISTKTVLLLKIVYGVEIKRVMASAKSALAKVNAIDVDEVNTNPQEFVNKLSSAATELEQLGEYIASKANDPDLSPEVQEQMKRAAEYQKQASENLIKAGNDLLQDRNNPEKKRALGDAIEDARNAINSANRPIGSLDEQLSNLLVDRPREKSSDGKSRGVEYDPQEMAYNIARSKQILEQLADPNNKEDPEELLKELEALLDKIKHDAQTAGELMDPQQQQAIAQLLEAVSREVPLIRKNIRDGKDISDSLNRLLQGLDQLGNMIAPYASKEQVAAELMKNDLEKLEKAADDGDGDTATRCAKRVIENQKNLEGGDFGDDKTGERQRENVTALSQDVPVDIRALKAVLNDPKPENKDAFKKANEVVKADARQVGAYVGPSGAYALDELLDGLQSGVREAVEASKDGNPQKLQEETAAINGARAKMQPAVARSANAATDPARRRNEVGKWKDLNDCLDDFMGALKGGDEIGLERKREKVLDAIEDYRDATSLDPLAAAEDLRRSAADFVAASVKDDREKVPQEARATQHAVSALHGPAQKAALRSRDPEIRDRVGGDLDKLDKLVGELMELGTQNVEANNNRDAPMVLQTAKEMNKKFDDIDNTIDDLTSALKPGVGKKHPDGPQSVEKDIPPHLRQLYAAAKELERKLPGVVGAAEDVRHNPKGQAEKDMFAKALEELEMPLRGIKSADSDEDKAVALSKMLQDHIEDMSDAARNGEPDGVVSGARLASDSKAKLGPLLEELASREQDPKKAQKIRDLAQQLENEFPKTIVAARNALQNPNDRQAQVELERAHAKVDDIVEGLRSTIQKSPEEQCVGVKEELQKSMRAVLGFVAANRKRDAVQEARRAAAIDLNPLKNFVHGLENEDDLLDALDRLYELLKDMEEQTPKAADSPAGSQERKDLEDMVDQASKILDKVVDESGAEALKAIQLEKRDLRELHDDMSKEDPANSLKADVKGVVANHRNVLEKLRNEQPKLENSHPQRAKELGDAIEEMEALMPQVIQKTKGVIINPDDAAAQRELDEAVSTLEVPLAKSANAIAPSILRDLKAKAKEIDRAGQSAAAGTMTGDMEKSKKGSDQLHNLKPLKDAVDQRIHEMEKNNPLHAKELKDKMREVEEAAKAVQRSANDPSKVGDAADKLSHKLRELEEAAEGSDVTQDVALAAAQKDDLLRALKGPLSSSGKLDMNDLLKMAMDLSDSMGGMIGKVEEDVKRQGGGGSTLDAIKQLRELERRASEPIKEEKKVEEKKPEPKPVEGDKKPKKARPLPVAPAANADFHEKVKHVAQVIDVAADSAHDEQLSSTAQGLSATLIHLAEAAQKGDRMGILTQTKDAVADLNRLVLVFKGIAEEITDRKMKDRMVWLSSMLKDVATNLKILCSVKAASGGPDNDDQIVSVITSVKNIFTEGLDLANIAEKTNKRRKA